MPTDNPFAPNYNPYRRPWNERIASGSNYAASCPDGWSISDEMTLSCSNPKTGHEYELDVTVFVEFEPAQNGGWDDPSWEAYYHSPVAYYFRPGHGWKEVELTKGQEEEILAHFEDRASDYDGPEPDDYYDDRDYY